MKTFIKNIIENPWVRNILILVAGLLLGWLLFGGNGKSENQQAEENHVHTSDDGTIWTCSMHPQIQENEPGQCPICGMDLIPMEDGSGNDALLVNQLQMTEGAAKIADIQTSIAQQAQPTKVLNLTGKIYPDETRIAELTARFPGRIEKLFVNFTGQQVYRGQKLATIYSPELLTAQKELFEAIKLKDYSPKLYQATRSKLLLWDLTEAQIEAIEMAGEPKAYFDILSPLSGTVTQRDISLGDYIHEGMQLFEVVNLSRLWVMFDAYESDLPWVKVRDQISFTVQSLPGEAFKGKISFIDPVIDPKTRVAKVRVEIKNRNNQLKPEMFARGQMTATIPQLENAILIPRSSVLWTGKRAVVYVKEPGFDDPTFSYRQIDLGQEAGAFYVVNTGLNAGEEVVTNGAFKIDAAAQLVGKPSMMNPEGGKISTGHNHGDMGGEKKASANEHEGHDMKTSANTEMSSSVDENFKKQLTAVYKAQLDLQEAFLATDPVKTKTEVTKVKSVLEKVNMNLVKGEMHNHWMSSLRALNKSLDQIAASNEIKQQRLIFADFNDALYGAIKMFGTVGETIYYQFCPMARNDKGAYWLSSTKEIKNPYFGDAMLTCGENKEVIQ